MGWKGSTYHLLGYHDHRLDGKPPVAVVKEVLEGGPEEVDDQNVVQALLTEVIDIRNTSCSTLLCRSLQKESEILTAANKDFVCSIFVSQLWSIALSRFLMDDTSKQSFEVGVREGIQEDERHGTELMGETHEFDSDLLVVEKVGPFKDHTERALSDLLANSIVNTDDIGGRGGHRMSVVKGVVSEA